MARHTKDIGIISITTIKLAKEMPESKVRKRGACGGSKRVSGREQRQRSTWEKFLGRKHCLLLCADTQTRTHTRALSVCAKCQCLCAEREKKRQKVRQGQRGRERDRHSRTFSLPSHMYEISRFAWDLLECACVCMCECMRMCVCACVSAWGYYHISCSTWAYFTCQCRFLCCYWKSKLDVCSTSWQFHWQTHKLRDR